MSIIAIVAALVIEQWRPLGERKGFSTALARYAIWLERTFNAGEGRNGTVAWLVAVVPLTLAAYFLHWLLLGLGSLFALAFDIFVLYLTFGFRQSSHFFTEIQLAIKSGDLDRARERVAAWRGEPIGTRSREEVIRLAIEEALVASHRHVFGVLLWYVLLPGPSGAVLYRLACFLRQRWEGLGMFGRFANQVCHVLDWPAVRLTAVGFAVVGDFEDALYCWRTQARSWPDENAGIVLAAGAGAMGVRLGMPLQVEDRMDSRPELGVGESADGPFLDSTVGLLWRSLVLWVFLLALLSVAGLFL